jgi:hypothetical protein
MTEQTKPLWWRQLQALESYSVASREPTEAAYASPKASPTACPERDADPAARVAHEQVLAWLSPEQLRDARECLPRVR